MWKPGTAPIDMLLVDAIEEWMRAPTESEQYMLGRAQGVARAIATLCSTSFGEEWERGLDGYQCRISVGTP